MSVPPAGPPQGATVGIPPGVTEETGAFWEAAEQGRLLIERCRAW